MTNHRGFAVQGVMIGSLSAACLLAGLGLPGPTLAQDITGIEEVVVTARKREESLQDTPISIQAFSRENLERRAIDNVYQIGVYTPNMVFDRSAAIGGSNNSAIVYIRGIGQDTAIPTIDLGVGTYVDGVYLARSVGSSFDLIDVERIEVLRGPQGTLFGRNTIGGAINVTTVKPSEDFLSEVTLTAGTDSMINGKVMVNGGITDTLFGRATFLTKNRDGYVDRPDGSDMGDEETLAARLAGRWLASDAVTVDLAFDVSSYEGNGAPFTLVGVNRFAPFPRFTMPSLRPWRRAASLPSPGAQTALTPVATTSSGFRMTKTMISVLSPQMTKLMCGVCPLPWTGRSMTP